MHQMGGNPEKRKIELFFFNKDKEKKNPILIYPQIFFFS